MLSETERKRVYWHSRRGMLELDLLLVPFVEEVFADLNETDQNIYIRLLACEDPDLLQWFSQKAVPEDVDLAAMVKRILTRVQPRAD